MGIPANWLRHVRRLRANASILFMIGLSACSSANTKIDEPTQKAKLSAPEAPTFMLPLTTFNELDLDINATPETVWDLMHDRARWMGSVREETTISGTPKMVGHTTSVTSEVQGQSLTRTEEIIVTEPGKRFVIKALTENPYTSTTFIDYNLVSAAPDQTELTLTIYLTADVPVQQKIPPDMLPSIRAQTEAGTQAKITEDHTKLKALAEQ